MVKWLITAKIKLFAIRGHSCSLLERPRDFCESASSTATFGEFACSVILLNLRCYAEISLDRNNVKVHDAFASGCSAVWERT